MKALKSINIIAGITPVNLLENGRLRTPAPTAVFIKIIIPFESDPSAVNF